MTEMNISFDLSTDSAMLCVFDPALWLDGSLEADLDESKPLRENLAVKAGQFAVAELQSDGVFRVRASDGELDPNEAALLNETIGPLGVRVRSGRLYISGYDLPGEPESTYELHGAGRFISVEPGDYAMFIHEIDLTLVSEEDRGILPDLVILFAPRGSGPFEVASELRFQGGRSLKRVVGTEGETAE